jgi:cyclopropane-fatty-acyl-phospholipid synthase
MVTPSRPEPLRVPSSPQQAAAAPLRRDTRTVLGLLDSLRDGSLELRLPQGRRCLLGQGEIVASLQVHDEAVFSRVLARGDIGFAEAYLDGQWEASDITEMMLLFARNREHLKKAVYGSWLPMLAARLRHYTQRNSRSGSRRNIMAHYDLGNAFYALWLDPSMSYSSALFGEEPLRSLESAQYAKVDRALDRLQAEAGQSLLEIGCGWGTLAARAVERGLRVSGITLSPAQLEWARRRAPSAQLELRDYRDLSGQYDRIVSIEMFEAVGERWWKSYFLTLARCLAPQGRAVVQSITIADPLFAKYRRSTDFIQQYIFPGGMLPSPAAFRASARAAGLRVCDEFAFGADYAKTLSIWRERFEHQWPQVALLGFDETFRRLWRLYLSYCEAGFRSGNTDVVQFELAHA